MKTGQGGSHRRDSLRRMRDRVAEERQGKHIISNIADVFAHFFADYDPGKSHAENNRALSRRIYKDTSCGAWASCSPPDAGVFLCGSIVEGTDAEVNAHAVYLPCLARDLDAAIQYVEDEAQEIWDGTHGCESCNGDGEVGGTINQECPACDGQGAIL